MQKILVPTEFTYLSKCALELGMQVANKARATVDVVMVIKADTEEPEEHLQENSARSRSQGLNPQLTQVAKTKALKHVDEIKEWFPGLAVTPNILFGDTVSALLDTISEQMVDLVIIGGDRYEPSDVSVDKFLRNATCPVLTVKCRLDNLELYKDIIFLVDPEKDSETLITYLADLQDLLGAKIHLLYVNTPGNTRFPGRGEEALKQYAKRYALKNVKLTCYDAENEKEGLLAYCGSFDHAFIAMAIHDRGFMEWLLSYNPTGEIIANSIHPVWTFKG